MNNLRRTSSVPDKLFYKSHESNLLASLPRIFNLNTNVIYA